MARNRNDSNQNQTDTSDLQSLKEQNRKLQRAVDELAVLNDLAQSIGGSLDSEIVMRTIISRSTRAVGAEQGDVTLVDDEAEDKHLQTLVRSIVSSGKQSPLHMNENLLGWMLINKKPLKINDPANDDRFANVNWDESIRSVLSAPLMVKSKLIGMLTVYNKKEQPGFTDEDKRLLAIIAAQSAQVVENARLYEEEKEYQLVQKEMELASEIQKKLLPSKAPQIDGYSLGGRNLTAKSVGGDYFDFIQIDDSRWALCLGDISGKGLSASLLMSNLQAILRGQVLHLDTPDDILNHANIQLFHNTSSGRFATLFLGILDTEKHLLHFANGGHDYPFLLRNGSKIKRLSLNGIPLGIMEDSRYESGSIELQPGECLFVYSDGITESMNANEELFGEERLKELLISAASDIQDSDKLIDNVFQASIEYCGKKQLSDDMTALVLIRNP